jgi:hypothetical protein
MVKEISCADFVRQVLMTWGKNAIVVKVPAVNPISVKKLVDSMIVVSDSS